ncbi:molybdopterin synthase sulfur carrier subunit [Runella defluvii]|uniref:Molybdopterin synthase sulfur carrier subunit n=1 Tax=Runella defluvii TaxID=370973 RepID=A0A7W5ZSB0_9BACT|nr:MoaD/ThiS family protein [Runella defluvii]MBB3840642.1 molybdopterin synthase sulfur carrier subunit [Runella defluvii]
MKITVLAFGIAKEIIGQLELTLQLSEEATVADLKSHLVSQFPDFQKLASLRVAVNTDYADDTQLLHSNDEIVLIPPVSGG